MGVGNRNVIQPEVNESLYTRWKDRWMDRCGMHGGVVVVKWMENATSSLGHVIRGDCGCVRCLGDRWGNDALRTMKVGSLHSVVEGVVVCVVTLNLVRIYAKKGQCAAENTYCKMRIWLEYYKIAKHV